MCKYMGGYKSSNKVQKCVVTATNPTKYKMTEKTQKTTEYRKCRVNNAFYSRSMSSCRFARYSASEINPASNRFLSLARRAVISPSTFDRAAASGDVGAAGVAEYGV